MYIDIHWVFPVLLLKITYCVHNATDKTSLCRLICNPFKANSLCMNYIENKKKVFVSPRIFHFPKPWIEFRFGGGGRCPRPECLLVKTVEIYTSFIFIFFRWLSLISIMSVTHTAKSTCSTVYLFHFVPVICVTFFFNLFLFSMFNPKVIYP